MCSGSVRDLLVCVRLFLAQLDSLSICVSFSPEKQLLRQPLRLFLL